MAMLNLSRCRICGIIIGMRNGSHPRPAPTESLCGCVSYAVKMSSGCLCGYAFGASMCRSAIVASRSNWKRAQHDKYECPPRVRPDDGSGQLLLAKCLKDFRLLRRGRSLLGRHAHELRNGH